MSEGRQNLLYTNHNPDPSTICEACSPWIGHVFRPEDAPPLPVHPGCYCTYFPTFDAPTQAPKIQDLPEKARGIWMRRVAWMLRNGITIPPLLAPLIAEAERYNEEREDESEEDSMTLLAEEPETRDLQQEPQMTRALLSGTIRLEPNDDALYDCLYIGAGRVRRVDGEPSNWLIPEAALKGAIHLFTGAPVYLDHPEAYGFGWRHQSPSLRDLAGVCQDAQWSDTDQGIGGKIKLYTQDENGAGSLIDALLEQIIADREQGNLTPEIGLSAVIWHESHLDEETGLRVTDKITKVDSVDFVYAAGARGYVRAALARFAPDQRGSLTVIYTDREASREDLSREQSGAQAPTQEVVQMAPRTEQGQAQIEHAELAPEHTSPIEGGLQGGGTLSPEPALVQDEILAVLTDISDRLDRLEGQQAHLTEVSTVEGMGTPPRGAVRGMLTGYDQVAQATEALLNGVRPPGGIRPLAGIRELYTLLSGDYEMTGVYDGERVYLANVNSSTMAQLVANVLNKRVMIAFAEYPQWWAPLVTIENFSTLQQVRWITLGGVGELPTVAAGAAYTELTWDDLAQRDSFVKKGGYLGLTLEAIDKDDTRQLQLAPRALAQAAYLTLSKSVSNIFTYNSGVGPNIYYDDSSQRALFHASNGNLGTTALSPAAWEATRQAMRDQAEHNSSEPLGALTAPRYCLVPNELEFTAIQTLATAHIPGSGDYNINPEAAGDTREARLRAARERVIVVDMWTDANNWAAVADPKLYPSIGLGFRFGETPEIFSVADPRAGLMFSNDVMPIKVRYFYAVGPVDYRGMYKHNVS